MLCFDCKQTKYTQFSEIGSIQNVIDFLTSKALDPVSLALRETKNASNGTLLEIVRKDHHFEHLMSILKQNLVRRDF